MSTSLILMIVCFLALMVIGLPIAYNLLITTVVYLLSADLNIVQLAIKMYGGMIGPSSEAEDMTAAEYAGE